MSSLKEQGRHETRSCFSRLSEKVFCFREEIWIFEHTKKKRVYKYKFLFINKAVNYNLD